MNSFTPGIQYNDRGEDQLCMRLPSVYPVLRTFSLKKYISLIFGMPVASRVRAKTEVIGVVAEAKRL
ncbi:hypothetical protein HI914_03882 [Erysiphe necator]|nr:hypothetical protein HI914_03882 [Erysiphe necator]